MKLNPQLMKSSKTKLIFIMKKSNVKQEKINPIS